MNDIIPIERHPLGPFLPENGRVLMLGSFPPQRKRWCMDFYYPNFSNDMWRVMGLVFYGDALRFVDSQHKVFCKDEIVAFLNEKGIGLFDTACAIRRLADNASDKDLEVVESTDIESLMSQMPLCRTLVATGQKAAETLCARYEVSMPKVGEWSELVLDGNRYRLFRMPSTSRAYPLALAKKAAAYEVMFAEILAK